LQTKSLFLFPDTAAGRRPAGNQNMDESAAMDEDDGGLTDDDQTAEVNNSRSETPARSGTVPDPQSGLHAVRSGTGRWIYNPDYIHVQVRIPVSDRFLISRSHR
jgi:hypothetical protein